MYRAYDNWDYGRGAFNGRGRKEPSENVRADNDTAPAVEREHWRALVHPLFFCPPIGKGSSYLLVRRTWPGRRDILLAGQAKSPHADLNLARVRQTAARLGANEVHILSK
jgi:hypothetical protein